MPMKERFAHAARWTAVLIVTLAVAAAFAAPAGAADARPLMRFPDIHGDTVLFVHAEDIWSVPAAGGVAQRLTIHDGEERAPKFSPDGRLVAFTGQYDGNSDVYVMNVHGGDIRRVTYHPGMDEVVAWHPTKAKIVFRSSRNSGSRWDRLFMIEPDGSGLEELPLHEAAVGSFSPDGSKLAFTRVTTEERTWKRYRGGLAPDLWLFDFATGAERKLTDFPGAGRIPLWVGERIYFSSDRDRTLNLYAYDVPTGKVAQVTRHSDYDVRRPSAGTGKIVYEFGGQLWVVDTATNQPRQIPVTIAADVPEVRPATIKVADFVTGVDLSPSGARALVVARGEVFSVPKKDGPTRNLTASSGARDKDAAWSPDGTRIAYISDASGEYELYIVDATGKDAPVRLTTSTDGYRHTPRWSPDSTKIAFADHTLAFHVVDLATRKVTLIDKAEYEPSDVAIDAKPISDYAWSPDSRFIAYSKMNADLVSQLWIHNLETGEKRCASGPIYNDFGPVFARDGERLFFVSNRHFDPVYCDFEWQMVYKNTTGVYALTLRKAGPPLLPFKSDEEPGATKKVDSGKDAVKKDAGVRVAIDFDGLADRIEELPLEPGNYRSLQANADAVFYLDADEGDFNRFDLREVGPRELGAFSFKGREAHTVIKGVDAYRLSADGETLAYRKGTKVGILDAGARDSKGELLDLSGLVMRLDPRAEWMQIFQEAWRLERDYYYEPNMHGIDWATMRTRYGALVESASSRQDVRYIVGELIGELNTSHTYVSGGDVRRKADTVRVGMLGADFAADPAANRWRFARILRVPEWTWKVRPPLAGPGIDVREGDYLLAVNGLEVTAEREVYAAFQGLAGVQVTLTVNDRPVREGAREVVVKPAASEGQLRYADWVEGNRRKVEQASGGAIGYLHLPDTYEGSSVVLPKYFYAQTQKQGLVVDGRFNGGGLDPDVFLERLARRTQVYWTRRYSHDYTTPVYSTDAHLVCLTNRQAGSGGDMLPMEFRMRGMGPIVGTRTWGGLVGVSMFIPLIDGGSLTAPDYRVYDAKGDWIVENEGVRPDVEVELDSAAMMKGRDVQLDKGIELLLAKIKAEPRPWPQHAPFPQDR
jgi:tricorn protease